MNNNQLDKKQVIDKLRACIEGDLKITIKDCDQDLIGTKVLDSYCMMLLISYINQELGVKLNMEKLDFDAFNSLNTLADLIVNEASSQVGA